MKNIIKLSLFLFVCFCCGAGIAQVVEPFVHPSFSIEDNGGCLVHGGEKEFHIVNKVRPENIFHYLITTRGEITARWKDGVQGGTIIVTAKDGKYGGGEFEVRGLYELDTNEFCVKTGCVLPVGEVCRTVYGIVQHFVNPEPIKGPDHIAKGKEYAFTVKPFLSYDNFSWSNYPDYLEVLYATSDGSSQTFQVKDNAVFGITDSICVTAGQCPDNKPICRALRPGTEMPEVEHDTLTCTDETRFRFDILDPNTETHDYWWKTSVSGWSNIGTNTNAIIITDTTTMRGTVTLYVTNNIDTISKEFVIIKKVTKSIELIGDTACINKGDTLSYYLYPSPDVEVDWHLPMDWHGDKLNPNSSSVRLTVGENAASGYVTVYSLVCREMLNTVFVSVQSSYEAEKGIHTADDITCFTIGKETEFYIDADPTAESYEWIFPMAWNIPNHLVSDPMDTVVNITIGDTKDTIKVIGTTCDGTWERIFVINQFAPVNPMHIELVGKSCINNGLADTITLVAVGAQEVTFYKWNYPAMWERLEPTTDSTIRLVTNGNATGNYDVSVSVGNQVCGISDTIITKTVIQNGIDTTIRLANELWFEMFPQLQAYPDEPTLYDYEWYDEPDFVNIQSVASSYLFASTSGNHCVKMTDRTTRCSSMKCTNPTVIIDTERDSIIVDLVPPAVSPTLVPRMLELPDDNSEDEETKQPTQQSVQKSAPKVKTFAKEPVAEPSFRFYPNPTKDNIHVQFDGKADYIEILNLLGVSQLKKRCTGEQMTINVSHLKRGFYLVKVTFGGKVVTEKLHIVE